MRAFLIAMRKTRTLGRMIPYVFVGAYVVVGFLIILPMMIWASLVGWLVDAISRKATRNERDNKRESLAYGPWGMMGRVASFPGGMSPILLPKHDAYVLLSNSGSLAMFAAILRASPGTGRRSKPISVPRPLPSARIAVTDIGIRDWRRSSNYQAVRGRPMDCPVTRGSTRELFIRWRRKLTMSSNGERHNLTTWDGAWCRRRDRSVARLRHRTGIGWIEDRWWRWRGGRHIPRLRLCKFD